MNIETFLSYHQLTDNPFEAEEARHDPVFERLLDTTPGHPDFSKILGQIDRPSTSVVFGEKGSGKTAIRMLIGKRVAEHNARNLDRRTLLVAYDDLNQVLDRVVNRKRRSRRLLHRSGSDTDKLLEGFRLEDHHDAILSLAVTRLIDAILGHSSGSDEAVWLPGELDKELKRMPHKLRTDVALLAALYDQPKALSSGGGGGGGQSMMKRWRALRAKLRLRRAAPFSLGRFLGTVTTLAALGLIIANLVMPEQPEWLNPVAGVALAAAIVVWSIWLYRHARVWTLARRIRREMPAVDRSVDDLRLMLRDMRSSERAGQPWPIRGPGARDSRFQLTQRYMSFLEQFGYVGMMVLVDRIDEPNLITGRAERMRPVVWPMFDNKFLQQDRVGFKLLLPVGLSHMLYREEPTFFQEARLDKQNLIDKLSWTGAVLYDLCTSRLRTCRRPRTDPIYLTDLFEPDVTREMLVESLDQMHQPRDAFKFLYAVIQEHCRMIPEDRVKYRVSRLVLESVTRKQAQRVKDLHRGLAPA